MLPPGEDNAAFGIAADDPDIHFVTAGSKGLLRVWNSRNGRCVFTQQNSQETEPAELTDLSYNKKTETFNVVTFEHNIIMYKKDTLAIHKQVI